MKTVIKFIIFMKKIDKELFEIELKKCCFGNKSEGVLINAVWNNPSNVINSLVRTIGEFFTYSNIREFINSEFIEEYISELKKLFEKYGLKPINCFEVFEYRIKGEIQKEKLSKIYVGNNMAVDLGYSGPNNNINTFFVNNVYFCSESSEKALEFIKENSKILKDISSKERQQDTMYARMLITTKNGLDWINLSIPPKDSLDIQENYSKEFLETIPQRMDEFFREDCGGIAIFRGDPGTGKSTYCKHLIKKYQKDINFLIVPQDIILSNPEGFRMFLINSIADEECFDDYENELMDLSIVAETSKRDLLNNISKRKTVVIIEDCEKLLVDRDSLSGNNTSIILADILNYTDGIVGDLIQCKFIFTFNTHLSKIDKALLRKGRMKLNYEFQKLKGEDLKNLLNKLKKDVSEEIIEKGLTLAEIYNIDEEDYTEKKRSIGF